MRRFAINFYPDEMVYSVVARLRVHYAIQSPKFLLELLYKNRGVSASVSFPNKLEVLFSQLEIGTGFYLHEILHQHTMLPLFIPFVSQKQRNKLINQMNSGDASGCSVLSGMAASKIPRLNVLRYCPECAVEQRRKYGEAYWQRTHQIAPIEFCATHNARLIESYETRIGYRRHEFLPANFLVSTNSERYAPKSIEVVLEKSCSQLLNTRFKTYPSPLQWTNYYRQVALAAGYRKGAYIDFGRIEGSVLQIWPFTFLKINNLGNTSAETSWLHSIFRKHRKSFSFLEHIVTLYSLLGDNFDIIHSIKAAGLHPKKYRETDSIGKKSSTASSHLLTVDQQVWVKLIKSHHPKKARSLHSALYARLFRSHHDWLIDINEKHRMVREPAKERINWRARDKRLAKKLLSYLSSSCADLSLPRQTRRQLMFCLPLTSIIEKYSKKLPITSALLDKYSESVFEYQIRRVTRTLIFNKEPYRYRRWFLLRKSGLSDERLTPITRQFIDSALPEMLPPLNL